MAGPLDDPESKRRFDGFIAEHAQLINFHAKSMKKAGAIPAGMEVQDLHGVGYHGLVDAIHKYDPKRGAKFSTFASAKIKYAMKEHLNSQIGIPKHILAQAKKLRNLDQKKNQGSE